MQRLGERVVETGRKELGQAAARVWLALPAAARARTVVLAPTQTIRREINEIVREGPVPPLHLAWSVTAVCSFSRDESRDSSEEPMRVFRNGSTLVKALESNVISRRRSEIFIFDSVTWIRP